MTTSGVTQSYKLAYGSWLAIPVFFIWDSGPLSARCENHISQCGNFELCIHILAICLIQRHSILETGRDWCPLPSFVSRNNRRRGPESLSRTQSSKQARFLRDSRDSARSPTAGISGISPRNLAGSFSKKFLHGERNFLRDSSPQITQESQESRGGIPRVDACFLHCF